MFVVVVLGVHLAGLFVAFGVVSRQSPAAALPALSVRVLELRPPPLRLAEPTRIAAPAENVQPPVAAPAPKAAKPARKPARPKPAPLLAAPEKRISPPLLVAAATAPATTSVAAAPQAASPGVEAAAAPAPAAAVVGARFDADYLRNPHPLYPAASRRLGEEGRVVLRVTVSAEGLPVSVEIKQASGFRRLDEAARAAVERWRFVPARRGSVAIESSVLVPLQFNLQD
ncbi:energy transducer TonB [Accumulibacter sp.]|uniref:energy transducer TonB n=1 Tax=Accumulibacter sp. TaxID=2053492 RepID=UPI002B95F199|nr:energy transducer TonB [Accumulibacter sp.]HRE72103.1 energy transducer TonB [Accumulibacter sp.]